MKPTQEQVIVWAREAGLHLATDVHWMPIIGLEYLEKATALAYKAGRKDAREKVAQWMMQRSYATGHGDTTEDLLVELEWQIAENWNRAMINGVETEREACAKVCEEWLHGEWHNQGVVAAAMIRARGQK